MKIMQLVQGTPEWVAHRFNHFNASEVAAMLGLSKKLKRNELLHMKATGNEREFSDYVRDVILASGHAAESAARPLIEAEIGESLYPIIGVSDEDPRLSVSFDGITFNEDLAFECKVWNEELVAQVRAGELREEDFADHIYQMEQGLLISTSTEEVIFVVAKADGSDKVSMRYRSVPERRAKIIPGWNQFEADLAAYVPAAAVPKVVAAPVETLPAIICTVNRADMTVTHNLAEYRAAVDIVAERARLPMVTDQDFADRKAVCKRLRDAEAALKAEADRLIGQMAEIAEAHRGLKDLAEVVRKLAIDGENKVAAEEKNRKQAVVDAGVRALELHIATLQASLNGRVTMPAIKGNFAAATKNLRTIASFENAVDTELARCKIEANATADGISANLASLDMLAADHLFLFADLQQLIGKPNGDFCLLVKDRIDQHKAKEQARLDAERERIAREEREKAEREARAKVEAEEAARITAEAQARQQAARKPAVDQTIRNTESVSPAIAKRPTDAQIALAVATAFNVDAETAIHWLRAMHPAALTALDVQQAA